MTSLPVAFRLLYNDPESYPHMNEGEESRTLPHPCHVHFGHFSSRPYFFGDDHIKVPKGPLIIKTESQTRTDLLHFSADVQSPNRKGCPCFFSPWCGIISHFQALKAAAAETAVPPGMNSIPQSHYPYTRVYICTIQTAHHIGSVCLQEFRDSMYVSIWNSQTLLVQVEF